MLKTFLAPMCVGMVVRSEQGMSEFKQGKNVKRNVGKASKKKSPTGDGSTRVLVLGVLSLVIPIVGVFLGIVALVLGVMYKFSGNGNGRMRVNVGMWMGFFSFVITLLGLIFFVPMLVLL